MNLDDDLFARRVPPFDRGTWIRLAVLLVALVVFSVLVFTADERQRVDYSATSAAAQETRQAIFADNQTATQRAGEGLTATPDD
jgi:hypothetical protein